MLVSDDVATPERFVKVLAIPSSELGREVKDILWFYSTDGILELTVLTDIRTEILCVVGMQAIKNPYIVAAGTEFWCELCTNRAESTGDEDPLPSRRVESGPN
jgi:hypothetical protein